MSLNRRPFIDLTFNRVLGNRGTIAPFLKDYGMQQVLTGEGATISTETYHTKLYSKSIPIRMTLGQGQQGGQLKMMTFVHKGHSDATVTVECPSLSGDGTSIVFSKPGDQMQLMWNSFNWVPIYSLNMHDLLSNTPEVI